MAQQPWRIEEIPDDKYTAEQKTVLDALVKGRGRLLTPYRIWIHSPKTASAMETLGTFLNKAGSLSEREVELGIVLIAHHWKGEYVYTAHVKRCLELGVPQSVIDAIRNDKVPDLANPRERAIYEIAKMGEQPGAGSDETFERAVKALGRNGLAELLALLGYYSAVAMAMKLHRVPVPR
jgi:4-carboxymuconolactone decarboxylase